MSRSRYAPFENNGYNVKLRINGGGEARLVKRRLILNIALPIAIIYLQEYIFSGISLSINSNQSLHQIASHKHNGNVTKVLTVKGLQ